MITKCEISALMTSIMTKKLRQIIFDGLVIPIRDGFSADSYQLSTGTDTVSEQHPMYFATEICADR